MSISFASLPPRGLYATITFFGSVGLFPENFFLFFTNLSFLGLMLYFWVSLPSLSPSLI